MAKRVELLFHDDMQFSVAKLGYPNLELKKEQYDVIGACLDKNRCAAAVLPTGCVDKCWLGFAIFLCEVEE